MFKKKKTININNKSLTPEDISYMVNKKEITEVKTLVFGNFTRHIEKCFFNLLAIKELAQG
jgi:hypothetical protein